MDRLPSSQHRDDCPCPECRLYGPKAVSLNEALGLPPLVRSEPCHGFANGCARECCQPRRARAARRHLVALPGGRDPRYAAARQKAA